MEKNCKQYFMEKHEKLLSETPTIQTFKVDIKTLWLQFAAIFPMPLECELNEISPSDIDSQMNRKHCEPQT